MKCPSASMTGVPFVPIRAFLPRHKARPSISEGAWVGGPGYTPGSGGSGGAAARTVRAMYAPSTRTSSPTMAYSR